MVTHYALTQADVERIQLCASKMPVIRKQVKRSMTGAALIELGYEDWRGATINPTAIYQVDTILQANTVAIMTRICREEGMASLDAACEHLLEGRPMITNDGRLVFGHYNY
ncbi:MAG: hypothetical protein ABI432_08685 [Flavobacteriales bacterium]